MNETIEGIVVGCLVGWVLSRLVLVLFEDELMSFLDRAIEKARNLFGLG